MGVLNGGIEHAGSWKSTREVGRARGKLEEHAGSWKSTQAVAFALSHLLACSVENYIPNLIRFFLGNQFGYVYLQPVNETNLILTSQVVMDGLLKDKNAPAQTSPWPNPPGNTNFRMCFVNYGEPRRTNYGHPEYQLLNSNQLTTMIDNALNGCPQYVILYSTNLPCVSPANPSSNGYRIPRCAPLTVTVRQRLTQNCPNAAFYLYTSGETPRSVNDPQLTAAQQQNVQNKIDAISGHDIIWLYP